MGILYNKSNIPIDVIISPELEVAKSLYRRLEAPGALDSVPFGKGKVKMLEISIEKNCPIKNIPLKDLTKKFPDFKAKVLGALRKEKLAQLLKTMPEIDPSGNTIYKIEDIANEHELLDYDDFKRRYNPH